MLVFQRVYGRYLFVHKVQQTFSHQVVYYIVKPCAYRIKIGWTSYSHLVKVEYSVCCNVLAFLVICSAFLKAKKRKKEKYPVIVLPKYLFFSFSSEDVTFHRRFGNVIQPVVAWKGDIHYRTSNCLLAKLKENVF